MDRAIEFVIASDERALTQLNSNTQCLSFWAIAGSFPNLSHNSEGTLEMLPIDDLVSYCFFFGARLDVHVSRARCVKSLIMNIKIRFVMQVWRSGCFSESGCTETKEQTKNRDVDQVASTSRSRRIRAPRQ